MRLESAQLVAIINGDTDLFKEDLQQAMIRKDEAKYAVIAHREAHGCGT